MKKKTWSGQQGMMTPSAKDNPITKTSYSAIILKNKFRGIKFGVLFSFWMPFKWGDALIIKIKQDPD